MEQSLEVDLRLWLGGDRHLDAIEEVIGLGRYGKTLTITTSPDAQLEDDDAENDDSFDERWTPRFPGRR